MFLITSFQSPKSCAEEILSFYQESWKSTRTRILGELVLQIPKDDKTYTVKTIESMLKNKNYDIRLLSRTLREGYFFTL